MTYVFSPVEVSVAFYTFPNWILTPWIKVFGRTDKHHCCLILKREDNSIILASSNSHRAKFVDTDTYCKRVVTPDTIIDLGMAECSIKQIENFIKPYGKLNSPDLVYYSMLGRFLFPSLLTRSCTLIICEVLRIMGYSINDYVLPRDLYKDLKQNYKERNYICTS